MNNDTINTVLREICDMQAENYGNGIDTHIDLIALCERGRQALASSAAPDPVAEKAGGLPIGYISDDALGKLRAGCPVAVSTSIRKMCVWTNPIYAEPQPAVMVDDLPAAPSSGESADAEAIMRMVDRAIPLVERRVVDHDIAGKPIYADEVFAPAAHSSAPSGAAAHVVVEEDEEFHLYLTGRVQLAPGSYDLFLAAPAPTGESLPAQGVPSDAVRDVLAERQRQQEVEGWTPEHDDKYNGCELAAAAATYAVCVEPEQLKVCGVTAWSWPAHWWKPTTYRRNLVKAGALLLAEIERLDRAAPKGASK